jgi:hypothetical protein
MPGNIIRLSAVLQARFVVCGHSPFLPFIGFNDRCILPWPFQKWKFAVLPAPKPTSIFK